MKMDKSGSYKYPRLYKKQGDFELTVEEGSFKTSHITVLLGENGTGKTTFIKMLAEAGKKEKKAKQEKKEEDKDNKYEVIPKLFRFLK